MEAAAAESSVRGGQRMDAGKTSDLGQVTAHSTVHSGGGRALEGAALFSALRHVSIIGRDSAEYGQSIA